jgi:hypothetical protein
MVMEVVAGGPRPERSCYGAIEKMTCFPPSLERHPNLTIDLSLSDYMVDLVAQRTDVAIRMGNLPDSS